MSTEDRDCVSEDCVVLKKDLLTDEQLEFILESYNKSPRLDNSLDNRFRSNFEIPDNFIDDWIKKLSSYIPIKYIYPKSQIIEYKYGGIKEHKDAEYEIDGHRSSYTLLIYLNSCDDGHTAVLRPRFRTIDEDSKNKTHERIFVKPKAGRCLIFNSKLYHLAIDTYENKTILHTRIF